MPTTEKSQHDELDVDQAIDADRDAAEAERFAKARLIADELLRASAECDRALSAATDALRRREEARTLLARTVMMPPELLNRLAAGAAVERALRHSGLSEFVRPYLTASSGASKCDPLAQADRHVLESF